MSIKSKDSKRKARRWSFAISTEDKGFHIPVLCFGTSAKADQIAARIKEDYSNVESLKGKTFNVNKIPHETISLAAQQQFDGLEFEGRLLTKVVELIYDDLAKTFFDQAPNNEDKRTAIGKYVVEAKKILMVEYYPEGASAITDSIEREEATLEEDDYKMPLGLEAVDEVLNGPVQA
jgi:hypothetical protein